MDEENDEETDFVCQSQDACTNALHEEDEDEDEDD